MRVNKKSLIVTIPLCILSFVVAFLINAFYNANKQNDFWVNILLGVFASALLIIISSTIYYHDEKEKCAAKAYYGIKQLCDQLKQFNLFVKMFSSKNVSNIIQQAYQTNYVMNGILINLYLSETTNVCNKETFDTIKYLQMEIQELGKQLFDICCVDIRCEQNVNDGIEKIIKIQSTINSFQKGVKSSITTIEHYSDDLFIKYINKEKLLNRVAKRIIKFIPARRAAQEKAYS